MIYSLSPSRVVRTIILSDKAFTHFVPKPCIPPAELYPDSPVALRNLPPACSSVKHNSNAVFPSSFVPIGIPRPLSVIFNPPSFKRITSIASHEPFKYSSILLEIISFAK